MRKACIIRLEGIVQGVGFRPFVHRLSKKFGLTGFVLNTSYGVQIHGEGEIKNLRSFYSSLRKDLPALARITAATLTFVPTQGYKDFDIRESRKTLRQTALVSPDISICPDCRKELFDARDRRYLYPFINCTNCGPRFSIIGSLPYDRARTTMKKFAMCPDCRAEYRDIDDRRYHAQPNACAVCGPTVELIKTKGATRKAQSKGIKAITKTIQLLKEGNIVAIKGIGGFHIACDAYNTAVVRELRRRKNRPAKPFAVMVARLCEAEKFCHIRDSERQIVQNPERPIVLLKKKNKSRILEALAPDNNYLGVMLCYAPLHYLIFSEESAAGRPLRCLVMTSGNIADEPLEIDNGSAMQALGGICDYFLVHDRDILNRCDDSLVQLIDDKPIVLRRGRGYAPFPFVTDTPYKPILACGAELKNTFCLTKNKCAFLSQYIGDLKTASTVTFYKDSIGRLAKMFAIKPKTIACDLHPEYLSTAYAQGLVAQDPSLQLVSLQHHQAHLASVIAEHRIRETVIGVCFDGIGYGSDSAIWGGEFFVGTLKKIIRSAHLEYVPMPGGDKATQEPYRMAISYLFQTFGEAMYQLEINFVKRHKKNLHAIVTAAQVRPILTSSAGRLFDAVSALLGICDIITYEAQAAIRLQRFAEDSDTASAYRCSLRRENDMLSVSSTPLIRQIVSDLEKGVRPQIIARKFHNGLARSSLLVCQLLRTQTGCSTVCLSGGVFQNKLFMESLSSMLRKNKFNVYYNELLPTNDGAISLGQAALANAKKS